MTLETKLQGTLGAQLLTIVKLETAVEELQAKISKDAETIEDLTEQLTDHETALKEIKCSQQSQD